MKKKFYCICTQASSKNRGGQKEVLSSPPTSSLPYFPKATQKANWKRKEIQPPSVDKQEGSLFGIHQATPLSLPEGEKKGKIHPPLVDNQEWNLLGIYQATPPPPSSTFPFFLANP